MTNVTTGLFYPGRLAVTRGRAAQLIFGAFRPPLVLFPGVLASTLERIVGQRSLGNVMCRYKGLSWGCEPVNSDSGVGFMRVLDEVVEAIVVLPAKQF